MSAELQQSCTVLTPPPIKWFLAFGNFCSLVKENGMHILSCAITNSPYLGLFTHVNQKSSIQPIYLRAAEKEKWQQLTSLMLRKEKWMYWVLWVGSFGTGRPEFCLFPQSEYGFKEQKTEAICEHNQQHSLLAAN